MQDTIVKAGRLFDGDSEQVLERAFVAVAGERIVAVGEQSQLGADGGADGARVLDLGDDATLLPGLVNMHTHMTFGGGGSVFHDAVHDSDPVRMIRTIENLRAALATGVTTIRDCGSPPHLALAVRDGVERGLLPGPRVVASGAITTTGGHCWYCATEADDEAAVRRAVRAHVKDGVDFIKLFATGGNLTPGTNAIAAQFSERELCAATEEARRLGRRTASHAHGVDGVRHSIAARVTTIEHCSFQTERGIGWEENLARQVVDLGIYVCPTVFRGLTKFVNEPDFPDRAAVERFAAVSEARLALTRRLAEAGVVLVAGNDAGVTHCGFSDYPGDLVLMTEGCGFRPVDVLRSATGLAAEALGRDDIGRLQAGRAADLLAVAGDPLADIRAIESVALVMARGRVVAGGGPGTPPVV